MYLQDSAHKTQQLLQMDMEEANLTVAKWSEENNCTQCFNSYYRKTILPLLEPEDDGELGYTPTQVAYEEMEKPEEDQGNDALP